MAQETTPAHPAIMEAQLESTNTPESAPLPTPIVTTPRLIIRALHPQDGPSMSHAGNTPGVSRYMTLAFPDPYTVVRATEWINMNLPNAYPNHFAICLASEPHIVLGGIGVRLGTDVRSHTGEIGFWIGEACWGKGYMSEALEGFTSWCFDGYVGKDGRRITRVWGDIQSGNVGSLRCFEKCGYHKEGLLKGHVEKHGEVRDLVLVGITKEDWNSRKG